MGFFLLHSLMHPYISPLAKYFKANADAESAIKIKAYMRNQFEFFGFKAATRHSISKAHLKASLPNYKDLELIVHELYALPQREYQYFALDLMAAMKKHWTPDIIHLIEFVLTTKSWWETVDQSASDLTGPYFKKFPHQIIPITGSWNNSSNFWLQRSSIMFQKRYKQETDTALLSQYILAQTHSKEFFIQKAIGWSLREYGKTNPQWVKNFVQLHSILPLSKREATRNLI